MNRIHPVAATSVLIALAPVSAGCGHNRSSASAPSAKDVGSQVSIAASSLTSGVAIGPLRRTDSVNAFRIGQYPVTVGQFLDCVSAGACSSPQPDACADTTAKPPFDSPTVDSDAGGAGQLPATCVGIAQAKAFCAWTGGALPSLKQFMLAGRGQAVARYPWGNLPATCAQRPDAPASPLAGGLSPCASSPEMGQAFAVGAHPANASPLGVEDVLLAPGELVAVSDDAQTNACAPPFSVCVAHGLRPGAIDGFEPVSADTGVAQHAYGFRCVWN